MNHRVHRGTSRYTEITKLILKPIKHQTEEKVPYTSFSYSMLSMPSVVQSRSPREINFRPTVSNITLVKSLHIHLKSINYLNL